MIQSFSFGEEWLSHIKLSIKRKYSIENPIFFIESKDTYPSMDPSKWINDHLKNNKWVVYKKTEVPNEFILLAIAPNPPDRVCIDIAKKFINNMKNYYKTDNLLFKIGDNSCAEEEASKELVELLKEGSSVIYASPSSSEKSDSINPKIVDVWVGEAEVDIQLDLGYLNLEYME